MVTCTLDTKAKSYSDCRWASCVTCGWNADVQAQRLAYLRQQASIHGDELAGLTYCEDGKRRLLVDRIGTADDAVKENAAPGGDSSEGGKKEMEG